MDLQYAIGWGMITATDTKSSKQSKTQWQLLFLKRVLEKGVQFKRDFAFFQPLSGFVAKEQQSLKTI